MTFTICVRDRQRVLTADDVFTALATRLRRAAARHGCRELVACFMPDHVHVTLEGLSEEADAWAAMAAFKQQTGFWLAQHRPGIRWQKDFYDHILRSEEDLLRHVTYILENPVRRGLAGDWQGYPYSYADPDMGLHKDPPPATTAG